MEVPLSRVVIGALILTRHGVCRLCFAANCHDTGILSDMVGSRPTVTGSTDHGTQHGRFASHLRALVALQKDVSSPPSHPHP